MSPHQRTRARSCAQAYCQHGPTMSVESGEGALTTDLIAFWGSGYIERLHDSPSKL